MLFLIHLGTRRVALAGITRNPTEEWMIQAARNAIDEGGVQPLALPPGSPNLNAFAERWVRSVKSECLSKFILFGETSLRRAVTEYLEHDHYERNHQGRNNLLLFERFDPKPTASTSSKVGRKEGLLNYYIRAA